MGLKTIGMTTNGIILGRFLESLKNTGMDQLNISLDTLNSLQYELMTRRKGMNHHDLIN